ncbi:MAG: flagellar hook-associated protein FlgL [Candidatus Krumholzibacteriia bacterium]
MGMRITDSGMSRLLVRSMQQNLSQMLRYQQMNSTMRRINSYADDPRGVGAVQRYDTLIGINSQYQKNLERSRTFVESTDSALQDLTDVLRDARDIALREASASGTDTSNDNSADEVTNLIGRLMNTLNANVEGNFLFGGFRTDLTPFVDSGGSVVYQGDAGEIDTQIGPHTTTTVNIPGSDFLAAATAVLQGTLDVAPPLTAATSLSDLNLGNGWSPGSVAVTDGSGQTWTLNLSGATTVGELTTLIATQTGGAVNATLTPDWHGLQLAGLGPLTIAEVDSGTTAQSLGILDTASSGTIVGNDVRGLATAATNLSDIPGLAGLLPLGSLVISGEGTGVTVDLSAATTVGDLQSAIGTAAPWIELRLDGGVLSLVSSRTTPFEVTDASGSTAATSLGLRGVGTPARMFGVFEDLRSALQTHDKSAMRGLMLELDAVEKMVLGMTVKVGGREVVLDWADTVLQQRDEQLQLNRSRERDADVIETASELSKAQAAYQASLLASSRLFQVNLMQYL